MTTDKTISLTELAALTGYSVAQVYWRANKGYVETTRDHRGFRRVPIAEVSKMARREKFERVA